MGLRIFIADDDLLIIKGLKKHIASLGGDYEVVGDAQNGKDALEMIRRLKPDLCVCDVKMPVLDGIELIKALRAEGNEVQLLMLSGYNDYNFLRDSIKCAAVDYLLKPIDLQEFDTILLVLAEQTRHTQLHDVEHSRINANTQNEQRLKDYIEHRQSHLFLDNFNDCKQFFIAVFSLDFAPEQFSMEQEATVLQNNLTTKLLDEFFLAIAGLKFSFCNSDNNMVLLLGVVNDRNDVKRVATESLSRLRSVLADYSCLPVTCAVGQAYDDLAYTAEQVDATRTLLLQRFYQGGNCMIVRDDIMEYIEDVEQERLAVLIDEVTRQLIFSELPVLKKSIENVFAFLERARAHPTVFLQALWMMIDAVYLAAPGMRELCINASDFNDSLKAVCASSKILTKMRPDFISLLLEKLLEYRECCQSNNNQLIELAKKYVRENFKEQISLKEVADNVHLNYSYLSELFKEKTGMNFTEYLTKIRMKEAKRFLRDPHIKVYEISDQVGYINSASFTRAFKKYTGMSPVDYRKIL